MTTLAITVGIPGCGKSTYAEKLREDGKIDIIVSSDLIREELTGTMENQDANREVFETLYRRVGMCVTQGANVLVDATNLKPAYRRKLIDVATNNGMVKVGLVEVDLCAFLFIDSADFDLCQARNLGRERQVPEFVMQRFHTMYLQNCTAAQLETEGWMVTLA